MSKSPPGARLISYKNMRAIRRATGSPMSVGRERALANVDATRHQTLPSAGARPNHARYFVIATAYLIAYLAINVITNSRQFHESGITLWSPDNGLSLLLLIESTYFAPIVLLASILTDVFVNNVRHSIYVVVASELVLTWGYLLIAIVLRDVFHFDTRATTYKNMIAVLAVVPASAAVSGILYCSVLYFTGALPSTQIYYAASNFWIGDTVGMIVVLPAATAIHDIISRARWRGWLQSKHLVPALIVGLCIGTFVLLSAGNVKDRYLFDLLFLPILWVGINYGYTAVTMTLLTTQLVLIAALTHFQVDDGDFYIFQTLMFVLATTGQLLGAIVTEREQATQLLRKQQSELARVSAHATTAGMAVTFAHEISQPLSSLSTYVHSARRMLDGGQSTAAVSNVLAKAEAEAQKTRRIIERVRDFVSSGKLELEATDIGQIARKIASLNQDEARARGVALTVEASAAPPFVRADRIAIEQALNNLVTNAIDAASQRGNAEGQVVVRIDRDGEKAILHVDDNGVGIAPEIADHLFQVFETTKPKGMGLGLSLTREIARRHSGRVGWRPLRPQGTSFFIELPIHGPETDSGQAPGTYR
jgi:two-component system, LuxR family, sensor kinase FixL